MKHLQHKKDFEMGILSGIAKGLGEGMIKIADQKREDQLFAQKQQAEIDREKRIEEAAMRREERQITEWTRQHEITRGEQVSDKEIARGEKMTDEQWKLNQEREDKEKQRVAEVESFKEKTRFSDTLNDENKKDERAWDSDTQHNPDALAKSQSNQINAYKLDETKSLYELKDKINNEQDPQIKERLTEKYNFLTNKEKYKFDTIDVPTGEIDVLTQKPILQKIMVRTSQSGESEVVVPKGMPTFINPVAATSTAKALADQLYPDKDTGWMWYGNKFSGSEKANFTAEAENLLKQGKSAEEITQGVLTMRNESATKKSDVGIVGAERKNATQSSSNENFNVFNVTTGDGSTFAHFNSVDKAVNEASDYIDRRAEKGAPQGAAINKTLAEAGHPQDESLGGEINSIERFFYSYAPPKDKTGKVINNTEAYVRNAVNHVKSATGNNNIGRDTPIDVSDPKIKKGLLLAIGAQEGEDAWKTHNKEFLNAIDSIGNSSGNTPPKTIRISSKELANY